MNGTQTMLSPQLRSMVENELRSGERVTWMGQPIRGRMARAAWPMVLFSIPFTAFAIFWTTTAAKGVSSSDSFPAVFKLFPLFGVPFILVGVGMLTSPLWVGKVAARTAYVLTDQRAILISLGLRGSVTVRSFEPEQLKGLTRNQYKDGSGDLVFTRESSRDSENNRIVQDVGFMGVPDVKSVEEMVLALANKQNGMV